MSNTAGELFNQLYRKIISISDAETEQEKFYLILKKLKEYEPAAINTMEEK